MRVGGAQVSTKAAGMSALWHDIDYLPSQHIHTPSVERGLDDLPLPSEQHQLPPGIQDPFSKLDQIYDVAGAQMERGLEGAAFLHGKAPPAVYEARALDALEAAQEQTRTMIRPQENLKTQDTRAGQEHRAVDQQIEARAQAGNAPPRVSNATNPANAKQQSERAQKALEVAEGLGVSIAAMAVGQALDPSGGMGATAASAVKAVSVSKTAVGMASSMRDEDSTVQQKQRTRRPVGNEEPTLVVRSSRNRE